MADDDKEDDKVDIKPGQSPTAAVEQNLYKEQTKKKQQEFKKAMEDVTKAAEVFFQAVDKAEGIYEEMTGVKKLDFAALRQQFSL